MTGSFERIHHGRFPSVINRFEFDFRYSHGMSLLEEII